MELNPFKRREAARQRRLAQTIGEMASMHLKEKLEVKNISDVQLTAALSNIRELMSPGDFETGAVTTSWFNKAKMIDSKVHETYDFAIRLLAEAVENFGDCGNLYAQTKIGRRSNDTEEIVTRFGYQWQMNGLAAPTITAFDVDDGGEHQLLDPGSKRYQEAAAIIVEAHGHLLGADPRYIDL